MNNLLNMRLYGDITSIITDEYDQTIECIIPNNNLNDHNDEISVSTTFV